MSSKQSVQFLASQLMGLGDRFRQQGNTETQTAIQKRYQVLAEQKFNEEQKRAMQQLAHQNMADMIDVKSSPEKEAAARAAYRSLPADQQEAVPAFSEFGLRPESYGGGQGAPGSVMQQAPQQGPTFGNMNTGGDGPVNNTLKYLPMTAPGFRALRMIKNKMGL